MPIHDWTRVIPGIFHDFHHEWIAQLKRTLNGGLLPSEYYALAEQMTGPLGPDVLTLRHPAERTPSSPPEPSGGVALATAEPQVGYRVRSEAPLYAAKADGIVIRHRSGHRVIAIVEIVSPGNKSSRREVRRFVGKAARALRAGIHLLIVDLFAPGPRDPQGIHKAIWDEVEADPRFALPPDRPLTTASYIGGPCPEAMVQFMAVGAPLPEMPLFLTDEVYVPVPLDATYRAAFEAVPAFWRDVLEGRRPAEPLTEA